MLTILTVILGKRNEFDWAVVIKDTVSLAKRSTATSLSAGDGVDHGTWQHGVALADDITSTKSLFKHQSLEVDKAFLSIYRSRFAIAKGRMISPSH